MIGRFIFSHPIRIVFSESLKTFSRLQNLRVLKIELSQHFFVPADVVKFITNQKKVNYWNSAVEHTPIEEVAG